MELKEVVQKLEKILKEPLPGRQAQRSMAPIPIDERRFTQYIRPDHRKGAVLMLFYPEGKEVQVPLIKRRTYEGVHSGQVAFPGGKWEPADGELSNTALRESEEEIGIDSNAVTLIGSLTEVYIPPSNFLVTPFIGFVEQKPEFKPDPYEVERIITCSFDRLLDKQYRKITKIKSSSGLELEAPYFDIEDEVVWGATAMMLGEFTRICEDLSFEV